VVAHKEHETMEKELYKLFAH